MPQYLVEKGGRRFQVEASDPEAADAAVSEMLGPEAEAAGGNEQPSSSDMQQPVAGRTTGFSEGLGRLGAVALAGLKRAPLAFAEGAGDLMLSIADNPFLSPATAGNPKMREYHQQYREAVHNMREADRQDPTKPAGTVLAGDVIAGLLPAGAVGKANTAQTLTRAVAQTALEGSALSNLPYDEESENRTARTLLGAAIPAAFRAMKSVPGAIMNVLARRVLRRSDPVTAELAKDAQAAFTSPVSGQAMPGKDDYTLAQVTGDPRVARFTSASADTKARDVVRQQLDQRVANVQRVADELGGTAGVQGVPDRAKALYRVVDQTDQDMAKANSAAYKSGMDALAQSPEGKAVRVPLKPVQDAMEQMEKEYGNVLKLVGDTGTGTRLPEIIQQLTDLRKAGASALNINGLRKLQEGINAGRLYGSAVIDPNQARLNDIRRRLQGAVNDAIQQSPDNAPGYAKLRDIAQQYAMNSDRRRELADNALTRLFGDKSVLADPEKAFDQFINLNPEAQRMGVALLQTRAPAQLAYMRKRYLDRVLDAATSDPKPGMVSKLDAEKLAEGLAGKQMTENPLFTAKERGWASAAAKDLRVILNSLPDTTKVGKDITLEDLSINVISRSPEFMTRFAVRAASGLGLEDLLFSPRGRQALSTVANLRGAPQVAKDRAAAYFIGLLAREDQTQQQADQQQQPEQQ